MQHTLFDMPDVTGMVHRADPPTSKAAATVIAKRRTILQDQVWLALDRHGDMTDEQLESLPEFNGYYGPSTIRKRRSELYQQGALVSVGERTNSRGRRMMIWAVK